MNISNILTNEKLRYLLIGIYNTVFGFSIFFILFFFFYPKYNYIVLLTICHFICITNNFYFYKIYVFKFKKNLVAGYLKFTLVYILFFFLNLLFFELFVQKLEMNLYFSQVIIISIIVFLGYLLNKNFSFK